MLNFISIRNFTLIESCELEFSPKFNVFTGESGAGKSILMVSSELPELMGVCHRIYVMSGGEITGEVDAASTTQEEIMTLAAKNV